MDVMIKKSKKLHTYIKILVYKKKFVTYFTTLL